MQAPSRSGAYFNLSKIQSAPVNYTQSYGKNRKVGYITARELCCRKRTNQLTPRQ